MEVFARDEDKSESARLVRNIGEMLTAMEVSAANRFWHVWESSTDKDMPTNASVKNVKPHINTYPKQYPKHVVGMMYDTMASFQVRGILLHFMSLTHITSPPLFMLTSSFLHYLLPLLHISRLGLLRKMWFPMVYNSFR